MLYKKWGAQRDFPRTRTVLQLLANVVADQWVAKPQSHLIHSSNVNLERERIRTKVLSAMGSAANESVIAADIIGGEAHADALDERLAGEYASRHIARGVATTILLHSAGGRTGGDGAMPSDIRLGSVGPAVGPQYVDEVLGLIEESCWYIHRDGELRRFQVRQNLFRRIAETAGNQPQHVIDERVQSAIAQAYGSSPGFRVLQWAGADGSIADQPETSIAVLAAVRDLRVDEDGAKPSDASQKKIDDLWRKSGGGFREWQNALVLVAPDRELWDRVEQAVRDVLAYESVLDRKAKGADDLSAQERKDLDARFKEKQESLRTSLVTAYRWVFYADGETGLTAIALPTATRGETIAERVVRRLSSNDYGNPKVLSGMSAMYFDAKIASHPNFWPDDVELELSELSRRFPRLMYLPILPQREATLRACIKDGIRDGLWSVVYGSAAGGQQRLIESAEEFDRLANVFDGACFLVKGELRATLRAALAPPQTAPTGGDPAPAGGSPKPALVPQGTTSAVVRPSQPALGPAVSKRYARVTLSLADFPVVKSTNLQPYLWKVLQEADASASLSLSIRVSSEAGIPEDALEKRIREGFEQLGIAVTWEPG